MPPQTAPPTMPADEGDDDVDDRRQLPGEADVAGEDRAHDQLALDADVEQPGAERDADGEPAEDQRRGVDQGLRDRPEAPARRRWSTASCG